jgi:hypothetical protein
MVVLLPISSWCDCIPPPPPPPPPPPSNTAAAAAADDNDDNNDDDDDDDDDNDDDDNDDDDAATAVSGAGALNRTEPRAKLTPPVADTASGSESRRLKSSNSPERVIARMRLRYCWWLW